MYLSTYGLSPHVPQLLNFQTIFSIAPTPPGKLIRYTLQILPQQNVYDHLNYFYLRFIFRSNVIDLNYYLKTTTMVFDLLISHNKQIFTYF